MLEKTTCEIFCQKRPPMSEADNKVNKINIFEALAANANGGMVTWPHLPLR
jgi:hypothetical protein